MNNKITVITGKRASGKSFLSKNIALAFKKPVFILGTGAKRIEYPWFFLEVKTDTDLIIIDDVLDNHVEMVIDKCYGSLIIEKPMIVPTAIISPKVIVITTEFKFEKLAEATKRKVEIIETSIIKYSDGHKIFKAKKWQKGQ